MNRKTEQALRMAIEAMEGAYRFDGIVLGKAINACKAALENEASSLREPTKRLSDEQINQIAYELDFSVIDFARAIENKLMEINK